MKDTHDVATSANEVCRVMLNPLIPENDEDQCLKTLLNMYVSPNNVYGTVNHLV